MENPISVKNLIYSYGDNKAVNDITFKVKKGEIVGFLGPNGAGKSTTIKMLTGQLRQQSGSISVLGKDPSTVKQSIGVCFERTNLYEQMTVRENLDFFARLFFIKHFKADHLLNRVGLGNRMDEKVSKLSKGLKQRLMIARALVNDPQILFLDEPTDGLDPVSAEAVRNIILDEKAQGHSVFLTTHDMFEAEKLADNIVFINNGKIVLSDSPFNLKLQYGEKSIIVDLVKPDGVIEQIELPLDNTDTGRNIQEIYEQGKVLRIHSREATLNDIFIEVTGRGLI